MLSGPDLIVMGFNRRLEKVSNKKAHLLLLFNPIQIEAGWRQIFELQFTSVANWQSP